MHIEFFVEEPSAEAALQNIVPKIAGSAVSFNIHPFQGKPDLLKSLPARLRGYRYWLPEDWRIVVLIDADQDDCRQLKEQLEQVALRSGLTTKSSPGIEGEFQVLNRLAVEELEAWFFGDVDALRAVFPRLNPHLDRQSKYRNPDAISGGTWEVLERLLNRHGYYRGGMPKIEVAREVSKHMILDRNRSHSFRVFRQGLLALIE